MWPAGFGTNFSLYYTKPTYDTAPGYAAIYSGLNGTGTLLATLTLALICQSAELSYGIPVPVRVREHRLLRDR